MLRTYDRTMKLNLLQVAHALDSPTKTIERWIRQGRIPIKRNGTEYIFQAEALEKWAAQCKLPFVLPAGCRPDPPSKNVGSLVRAMRRGKIFHFDDCSDIQFALALAVTHIPGLSPDGQNELFHLLLEREKLASTGIGKGVAIPHPRTPLKLSFKHPLITTCFLKRPINYNAIDGKPVFVLFILLSSSVKDHLNLISRLSFCLRDSRFISFLRQKPSAEFIFQKIAVLERALDKDG